MTAKERLLGAIYRKPIDRVPVSTYGFGWNDASWECKEPAAAELCGYIRQYTDQVRHIGIPLMPAQNAYKEKKKWREGNSTFIQTVFHAPRGDLTCLKREDDRIATEWTLKHLLNSAEDAENFLSIPYERLHVDAEAFRKKREALGTDGLLAVNIADPFGAWGGYFPMEELLVLALTETSRMKALCERYYERNMEVLQEFLCLDVRDVIFNISGPEFAAEPYLPVSLFDELVNCYLIDMCREIKRAGGIPRIHCHGRVKALLPSLAKTDAMMLEPLEPAPQGDVTLSEVKRGYGEKFCLMGNIEYLELETASPGRIDALVHTAMEEAMEGGGFILLPTTFPITYDLSPTVTRNYLQMFESAHKYGTYK